MKSQILSLLVSNHFGVLTRVTNLFSRRGFNIKQLTVGETDNPQFSRITILTEGDEPLLNQIQKQLIKLEDVKKVIVLPDDACIGLELLLIKIKYAPEQKDQMNEFITSSNGRLIGAFDGSVVIEFTGQTKEVDNFIDNMKKYGKIEVCRTGVAALQTGRTTIYD